MDNSLSKEIWLGPLLGNNRSYLIRRCADLVAEGKSDTFLYIAASHPLLELVTEQILDGPRNQGLWGELPVYLFRGFVRQVLSKAVDEQTGLGLAPRVPIDREELPLKRSLVAQILAAVIPPTLLVPDVIIAEATSPQGAQAKLPVAANDIAGRSLPVILNRAIGEAS